MHCAQEPTFWEKTFNQESEFFSKFRGAVVSARRSNRAPCQTPHRHPPPTRAPLSNRMQGGAGSVAGGVGDRVFATFGETEQAEAMRELRLMMPDFRQANT